MSNENVKNAVSELKELLQEMRVAMDESDKKLCDELGFNFIPISDNDFRNFVGRIMEQDGIIELVGPCLLMYEEDEVFKDRGPMWINTRVREIAEKYGFNWEWVSQTKIQSIW